MVSIIIPQAFRIVIPPLTNELVLLFKDSSLVLFLGVTLEERELTKFRARPGEPDRHSSRSWSRACAICWSRSRSASSCAASRRRPGRPQVSSTPEIK